MAFESQRDGNRVTKIEKPLDLTTLQEQIKKTQRQMQTMITNINSYASTNIKGLEKLSYSSLSNLNNKIAELQKEMIADMQDLLSNFSDSFLTKQEENGKEVYKLNASMIQQLINVQQDAETKLKTQRLKNLNDIFEQNRNLTQQELNNTLQTIEEVKLKKNLLLSQNPTADTSSYDQQIINQVNLMNEKNLKLNVNKKIEELKNQGIIFENEEELKQKLYDIEVANLQKTKVQKLKDINDLYESSKNNEQLQLNDTLQKIEEIKLKKNQALENKSSTAEIDTYERELSNYYNQVNLLTQSNEERIKAEEKIVEMRKAGVVVTDEEALKQQLMRQEENKQLKENNKLKKKLQTEYNTAKLKINTNNAIKERQKLYALKDQREEAEEKGDTQKVKDLDSQIEEQQNNLQESEKDMFASLGETFKSKLSELGDDIVEAVNKSLDATLKQYNQYQQKINVRTQGTKSSWNGILGYGGIESTIKTLVGINPYVSLTKVFDNVVEATEQGITFDIEQRAFLQTIKDSIAATFDAFDSNLTQLIRNQQADTTAARLGMEASLTKYYNAMFTDSSYLTNAFDQVSSNLYEALTQVSADESVAIEYQVQKWLGSLYSVGFSSNAVTQISQALGNLGSGNISALSNNSTMQNLLVMAMSRAGLNYSDFLMNGLTAQNTNQLMQSMVEYLAEISQSTNQVVKSEYASMFGMTVSDLSAVQNIASDISTIAQSSLNYTGAINELSSQMSAGNLYERLGISSMLENVSSNAMYSLVSGIASNPVLYLLYKAANVLEEVADGIDIPAFSVFGNMIDLETDVSTLLKAGVIGMGAVSTMVSAISGLSSTLDPSSILTKLGISSTSITTLSRGTTYQNANSTGGQNTSLGNYVAQGSGSDIQNSVINNAQGSGQSQLDVKKEEEVSKTSDDIYNIVNSLYELFNSVKSGNALNVITSYDTTGF